MWQLFDPLDDGRRTGIPVSPRWVRPGSAHRGVEGPWDFFGILRGGERTCDGDDMTTR